MGSHSLSFFFRNFEKHLTVYRMTRNFFFILAFAFLFLLNLGVEGQELYRTVKGKIEIRGQGAKEGLTARSNELFVRVEHETGSLFMRLDQSTLRTGVDSIDRKLDSLPKGPITFEGELARGSFDPRHCYSSSPLKIEGTLSYMDYEKDVRGKGAFKSRISNDRIPCLLEIGMQIDVGNADKAGFLPGFKEDVNIHILQALLNPEK